MRAGRPTLFFAGMALAIAAQLIAQAPSPPVPPAAAAKTVKLPAPRTDGGISVEKALKQRRALRNPAEIPLTVDEVSQLLWALQGITDDKGHRTAPSAWAKYPLEVYLLAGNVTGMNPGLYHYLPKTHELVPLFEGDRRASLVSIAERQEWIRSAPAVFFITGVGSQAARANGSCPLAWMYVEAGLAAQGFLLQAVSLGLGSTYVGGFDVDGVRKFLGAPAGEEPISLLPVGRKAL